MKEWFFNHISQIAIALIAVLSPVGSLMIAVGCLIFFDFVTGIAKAYKSGEKITSKKMSNTVSKIIFYNIAIFTGIAINFVLATTLINAVSIIASGIASIEGYSILENISIITNTNLRATASGLFDKIKDRTEGKNPVEDK